MMSVEIFETITLINPDQWNRLTEGQPFATWQWLQADEALSGDGQARYVLLTNHGDLQAGAVCSVQSRFHSRMLQASFGWLPRHFPYVRCDMPFLLNSGLFFADPTQCNRLLPELLAAVKTVATQERALFYSFDHLLVVDPAWPFLQRQNLHCIQHISEAYLEICWASQAAYLDSLSDPSREEYLHIQELLELQNILIETAVPTAEDPTALHRLICEFALQNKKPHQFPRDFFSTAFTLLGLSSKLIVARQNHHLLGCLVLLQDARQWLIRWPGLATEHDLSAEVYSAMLAASIQQVILAKGQRLYLGVIDPHALQNLGATFEKRFGLTAVRSRPLHWLAGKLLKFTANPDAVH